MSMKYEDPEEELDEEDEELEEEVVGICDGCGIEVDETEATTCPICGAIYHDWCMKDVCKRCGTAWLEPE